jgi:hypothetical protein
MEAVFGRTILEELPTNMIALLDSENTEVKLSTGALSRVAAAAVCVPPVFSALPAGKRLFSAINGRSAGGAGFRLPTIGDDNFFEGLRPFLRSSYQAVERHCGHEGLLPFGGNIILDFKYQGNNLGDFVREARTSLPGGIRGMEPRIP